MTDYTPGPWRVVTVSSSINDWVIAVVAADGTKIADDETYYPAPLDPRNAHLIAAAPDLLAALELALSDFDNYGEVWQSDDEDGVNFPAINAARAAIAKARGEN